MEKALGLLLKLLPLIFAFGFLVPVIAAAVDAVAWQPPLGLSGLTVALIIGGAWGVLAQIRGRWI